MLLLAAGGGERLGREEPKAFVPVAGVPMLRRSADAAAAAELVEAVVAVVPSGVEERASSLLDGLAKRVCVVAGGATRQGSAARGLEAVGDVDAVAVHDAARPLCPPALFDSVLRWLDTKEAVITAVPVWDTLKHGSNGWVERTIDRAEVLAAQTPQAFRLEVYRRAHDAASRDGFEGTDDASLVERLGVRVWYAVGDRMNIKITTTDDLRVAEALL